jgi:ABC-type phosphate/phosphonate transport system substrate-binding protein
MRIARAALSVVLMSLTMAAQAEEFTFAVEPSYPVDQAQDVYKPLIDYLARTTGHTFTLNVARNYHFYWRDMRQNADIDFVYEEAHFTEFRANRFGYIPLVRKAEPTVFALLADPAAGEGGTNGLIGRRVITMPSPSLEFAILAEFYKNPVSQPDFRSEASSWRDGVEMVFSGDAEAAMVPSYLAQQYPNLVEVTRSRDFPGTAVSAAATVPEDVRNAVRDALLKLHEDPSAYDILVELGATKFEPATPADFTGYEKMLSGFFGYKDRTKVE